LLPDELYVWIKAVALSRCELPPDGFLRDARKEGTKLLYRYLVVYGVNGLFD
jgi:hypothetical protein